MRHEASLLKDILAAIGKIEGITAATPEESFFGDEVLQAAVLHHLTVIGEAANRLPQEFKDRHPDVPWHRIVGLRHRVVHDYFDVDLDLVWTIVETELPQLAAQLSDLQTSPHTDGEQ